MSKFTESTYGKDALILGVILIISFFCFLPVLKNDFTNWDDKYFILENPSVLSLDWPHIVDNFKTTVTKVYVPLTILSWALEHHVFGFDPFVFHLNNLLLHLGVTAFVFWLARCMRLNRLSAFLAALLFGIHPIHVESVAWLTERKDVLYAFFYMASLISYWKYIQKPSWRPYCLSILLGMLSMLAKPMALSLPLAFFVLDWYGRRKWNLKIVWEKVPHALYIIPIAAMTFLSFSPMQDNPLPGKEIGEAVAIWFWSFSFYITKFLWPYFLVPYYQLPEPISLTHGPYFFALIVFMIVMVSLYFFRKNRLFLFAFYFHFASIFFIWRYGTLINYTRAVADRFTYLPCMGFCFLIGWFITRLWERVQGKKVLLKILFILCPLIFYSLLFLKTIFHTQIWKDSITLWTYVIEENPRYEDKGFANRAYAHCENGNYDLALKDANKAIEIKPTSFDAHYIRGIVYDITGQKNKALEDFNTAIQINPQHLEVHKVYTNRADLYVEKGLYDLAIADSTKALSFRPNYARAFSSRGKAYAFRGFYSKALSDLDRAIFLRPLDHLAYYDRGFLHMLQGQLDDAITDYSRAIELKPDDFMTIDQRGTLFFQKGHYDDALKDFNRALKLNPRYARAYNNRGTYYLQKNAYDLALLDFNNALSIDPQYAIVYFNRSLVYNAKKDYDKALRDALQATLKGYAVDTVYLKELEKEVTQ